MLHELIGLAQAKPGSKFVEVYRHAGGGRGRTPVNLQVRDGSRLGWCRVWDDGMVQVCGKPRI